MRIAMVGVGGVGGYFGGKLAQASVDLTFIARGATLEALRTRGLRVDSINGDFVVDHVQATDNPATAGTVDAIFLAVKAWQIAEACEQIRPMLGDETMVIPLENGMEGPEIIAKTLGARHAMGGLCAIVSYIVAPGHIRHVAADPFIVFGELDHRRSERAERLRETLVNSGVQADIPDDVNRSMWTKFLFIAPMSGMGAITRVPLGAWRSTPETRELATTAIREMIAIANARGVTLSSDAVEETLGRYDALPPESTSSLQRDVMEGKPSELDAQLGAVVRMASEVNVAAPVCTMLYHCLLPQERKARGM